MSLPTSPEPGSKRIAVRKPGMDIYTVLLIIATIALLIGILLFVLELNEYNWTVNPTAWLGDLLRQGAGAPTGPHLS